LEAAGLHCGRGNAAGERRERRAISPHSTFPNRSAHQMTTADVMDKTHAYLLENFLYMRPDFVVGETDSLLRLGIIDSLGVMELVQFLDAAFGVTVDDDEITEDNLGSLAAIARFVVRRLGAEPVRASA
jgi:acyl carrier protein